MTIVPRRPWRRLAIEAGLLLCASTATAEVPTDEALAWLPFTALTERVRAEIEAAARPTPAFLKNRYTFDIIGLPGHPLLPQHESLALDMAPQVPQRRAD